MKAFLATVIAASFALFGSSCATRKYVRNTTLPIQAKVDQVGDQTNRNGQAIEETKTQVKQVDDRAQNGISAAQERASTADQHALTADQHATEAHSRADSAYQSADQNRQGLDTLRTVVTNLDDYRLQDSAQVTFGFDKYALTETARQDLDRLADSVKADKRFFIAVEGFTDSTGSATYNEGLSKRRADSVVEYLVGSKDVPIYRIHMVGLGEQKLVDEGRTAASRAKNRRVEVKVFTADQATAALAAPSAAPASTTADRVGGPNQ